MKCINLYYSLFRRYERGNLKARTLTIFPFLLLLFIPWNEINAQDILVLKSGKEIKAVIIEEGTGTVKYLEYDNQSGPVFTLSRDRIAEIRYGKSSRPAGQPSEKTSRNREAEEKLTAGELTVLKRFVYQNNQKLGTRTVKTIMEDNAEALSQYESGNKMCNISNAFPMGIVVTSFITSTIMNKQNNQTDKITTFSIGMSLNGVLAITGIVLASKGKSRIRKSVEMYNAASRKPVSLNISAGIQNNGLGISLKF